MRRILREATRWDERQVASLFSVSRPAVAALMREAVENPLLVDRLQEVRREAGPRALWADLFGKSNRLIYALVRLAEPSHVVETGVANGVSSLYILAALEKNAHGTLHSLDLGRDYLSGKATGWIVPRGLQHRWDLRIGDAKELLPKTLEELAAIDVFIHDSDHSYEHMFYEFELADAYLTNGGMLLADDAEFNEAFPEFVSTTNFRGQVILGLGVARKG